VCGFVKPSLESWESATSLPLLHERLLLHVWSHHTVSSTVHHTVCSSFIGDDSLSWVRLITALVHVLQLSVAFAITSASAPHSAECARSHPGACNILMLTFHVVMFEVLF
jgi:hypothetical protein